MVVAPNAIRVHASLQVTNDQSSFAMPGKDAKVYVADQTGTGGGVPGQHTATVAGNDVDLSELSVLGYYDITNDEPEGGNWVEYGPFAAAAFHKFNRIYPGKTHVAMLAPGAVFHTKADTADVKLTIRVCEA